MKMKKAFDYNAVKSVFLWLDGYEEIGDNYEK